MPQKQSTYEASPTQATTRATGNWGGEGGEKSMAGAPGAQNMMGGLFGGLLGGSRQGNVTPTSVKGFMPSGGGGLLGGLLGAARYTSIRDMFNGGGPGQAGERFYGGGMLSAGLNRAGVRPAGYQGLMAAMASQAAQKAAQPGYTPAGYGAAPTGGLGAPAGAPAPSGGLGAPAGGPVANIGAPLLGSGMTPANAYATAPVAPLTYGPQTRPNVTPGLSYGPQAAAVPSATTGLTGPAAVAASQAAYAEMVARIEAQAREEAAAARAEAERRAREQYQGMMVAP